MENKYAAQKKYAKNNLKKLSCSSLIEEFADSCRKLDIKQSDVIRKAMQDIINKAKGE